MPLFANQFINQFKNLKIEHYGIYTKGISKPPFYTKLRYVSKELESPVSIIIYSDKVFINIWEPNLIAIIIKNKIVANKYKKYFDLVWKIAKP